MGAPGLIAAFTAGAATLAGGRALVHWGIRKGLAAPRVPHHTEPGALGLAFETLRIGTENGKSLHAWFIPGPARATFADAVVATAAARKEADVPPAAAPAVVVMHGWGGNAALMLPLARPLHEAGYATLFVDARCHGASDDDSFASLPRFAEDTEHAFAWHSTRAGVDPARIALLGHSVGAGAVLFAASRTPQVAAVVSVAAFSHPAAMMRRWLAAKRIPEKPIGRYVLDPAVFSVLERTEPGRGGEIQLTDALCTLAQETPAVDGGGVVGVVFRGRRYDTGDRLSYLQAVVTLACERDDLGPDFARWLKGFVDTL